MTITSLAVEVTPEAAEKAYSRAKSLLSIWAPLVRAIARNQKLKVELTGGAPRTDGKTVYLRVPIELGTAEHDRGLCGKWDDVANNFECPACAVELHCDVNLFHEVAHLVAGTFSYTAPTEELLERLRQAFDKIADRFDPVSMARPDLRKKHDVSDSLTAKIGERVGPVDPFTFQTFNVVEDSYVNATIIEARPGLKKVFRADYESVFKSQPWSEQHPFIQACVAWTLIASQQEYCAKYLKPDVWRTVQSSSLLVEAAKTIHTRDSVSDRWIVTLDVLDELKRLGLGPEQPEEQPDEESPGEGQQGDEGDASEDEQAGDSGDSDDGDDGSDSQGGDADDDELDTGDSTSEEASGSGGTPSGEDDDDTDAEGDADSGDEADGDTDDESGGGDGDEEQEAGDEKSSSQAGGDSEQSDANESSGEASDSDTESGDTNSTTEQRGPQQDGEGSGDHKPQPSSGDSQSKSDWDHSLGDDLESSGKTVTLDPKLSAEALGAMTGHEDFGNLAEQMNAEAVPSQPSKAETDLLQATISMDGYLEGDKGNILELLLRPIEGTPSSYADRFKLPLEVRVRSAQAARLTFAANHKSGVQRDLRRGRRLDRRTMSYRVPTGDDRVFTTRSIPKKRDWSVLVGIDCSGSAMSGAMDTEKALALGIGDLLTEIGVPFSVFGHTGSHASEHGMGPHGEGAFSLILYPCKSVNDQWSSTKGNVASLHAGNVNLDGHTMQAYRKILERQPGTDKLLIYFTDGAMPNVNYRDEKEVLIRECALAKKSGLHVIGVGIGTDSPRQYGLDTVEANGVGDIPNILKEIGKRITL